MKQFSLKEYLANPLRKVVTRYGRPVRILCTDANGNYPVIALVPHNEGDVPENYTEDGRNYLNGEESACDLFFAPERKEGWVNLYRNVCGGVSTDTDVFSTKEHAQSSRKYENYLGTVKIEWED